MTYARTRPAMNCCPKPPGPRRAARGGLGAVAQLEERFHGMEEVRSSSLRSSTLVPPGAMAQLVARLVRNEKAGSSSLPSSTEPSGPSRRVGKHEQFVTGLAGSGQCGTCRDRRHAGRLKRLVELQAKVTAAIAGEEQLPPRRHGDLFPGHRPRTRDTRVVGRPRVSPAPTETGTG